MTRSQQPALTLFAIGMIGLGVLALIYGDFAMVWQPVAPWIPGRTALAYASGVIMLLGGIGLLFAPTAAWAARILFPYLIVWLLLKVPALVVAPKIEAVWLGVGEIAVLLTGGWVLFATLAGMQKESSVAGENGVIRQHRLAIGNHALGPHRRGMDIEIRPNECFPLGAPFGDIGKPFLGAAAGPEVRKRGCCRVHAGRASARLQPQRAD